jgi:hypothetical protein
MQGFLAKYLDGGRPHFVVFAQVQQQPRFDRIHAASLRPTKYISQRRHSKNFSVFKVPCHRILRHLCVSSMHSFLPQLISYWEEGKSLPEPPPPLLSVSPFLYHNIVHTVAAYLLTRIMARIICTVIGGGEAKKSSKWF